MSGSAVGYAVAAAICFALASAPQHPASTDEQGNRSGIRLLWRLARNRRWAAGLTAAAADIVLHAAALHAGALAVVQPVLLMSLALALPVRPVWTFMPLVHTEEVTGSMPAALTQFGRGETVASRARYK